MIREEEIIEAANNLLQTMRYIDYCEEINKPSEAVKITLKVMLELYRREAAKMVEEFDQQKQLEEDFITFLEERGLE